MMCRLYRVTRAGFYAWRSRGLSPRAQDNATLVQQIIQVHPTRRALYGSPRVYRQWVLGSKATKNIAKLLK